MARLMPPVSPCGPWPCSGTSTPTELALAAMTRLVARRSTTLTASSTIPTGSTTCSSPPPWEVINYEPRNPIESAIFNGRADKGVLVHLRDSRLKLHLHCNRHLLLSVTIHFLLDRQRRGYRSGVIMDEWYQLSVPDKTERMPKNASCKRWDALCFPPLLESLCRK